MFIEIQEAFEAIGAELFEEKRGNRFEIDIESRSNQELYRLRYPQFDDLYLEAMDVKPRDRHLVLDVAGTNLPISGRFLCGHDERHWFVAALPFHRKTTTVRGAMEALKPELVRREQKRKGVKHRRNRRKTAAYHRQGEWFFLPRPKMNANGAEVQGGVLVRGQGKPHRVEWIYHAPGGETFVRGAVSHPDHETIRFDVWHRVVQNQEPEPTPVAKPVTKMLYID
ncbi:Hypothetical protein PBC10988_10520 [Planctomycetales bacterium 10988]|nr:Hypothetical protein PBC10988_10520 [Planctomycetales bacterium 10988]